ncbi:MAG TPA: phosphatase PAP2 family protein [Chitinophagaceae bacterium]
MYRIVRNKWKRFWASIALLSLDVIIVLILFAVSLVGFVWIAKYIFLDHKTEFDDKAFAFLSSWVSDLNTNIMNFFTFLGKHQFLIPAHIVLIGWFLFIRRHRWYSIKVPVIGVSSALIMLFLKDVFQRERPLIPLLEPVGGLSFPSGHALCSMTFFGLLIYFTWKHAKHPVLKYLLTFVFIFTILMIGLSRVYLRVHHASDVLAGFAFGLIWLVLSLRILKSIENQTKKKVAPVVGYGEAPTVTSNTPV